jgi:hypothetical protein
MVFVGVDPARLPRLGIKRWEPEILSRIVGIEAPTRQVYRGSALVGDLAVFIAFDLRHLTVEAVVDSKECAPRYLYFIPCTARLSSGFVTHDGAVWHRATRAVLTACLVSREERHCYQGANDDEPV